MLGNDVIVYVGGVAVAAAKSCSIDVKSEVIEVASPDTGTYRKYIAGRKSWNVSVNYLVTDISSDILTVGTTVTLKFGPRGSQGNMTGSAIVRECNVSGARGNIATGSFRFEGISALTAVSQNSN